MKWFRFYSEVLHDPKILRLSDREFRTWVLVLCAACEGDGEVAEPDLPLHLRQKPSVVEHVMSTLRERGLFDATETGIVPHNWQQRQYKSDVSTERVKRFRERTGNVSETPPETEQKQNRTETETKTDAEADHAPALPFALAFVKQHQTRNAGNRPSSVQHAEAIALEREHGSDWCFRAAEAFDWQKPPAYLRPWIIDHKAKELANGESGATGGGKSAAQQDPVGVADRVHGLDRRGAALAELRRTSRQVS